MSDEELVRRLRIKDDTLPVGESIAWGSDSEIMHEAADAIERLTRERDKARAVNAAPSEFDLKVMAERDAAERKVEKLRAALKSLLDVFERCETGFTPHLEIRFAVRDSARAALAETEECK